jgi:hypothetical protein
MPNHVHGLFTPQTDHASSEILHILYPTEFVVMPQDNTEKAPKECTSTYERDWKFFATGHTVEYKGHKAQGLRPPPSVLRKFYRDNALRWIPGVARSPESQVTPVVPAKSLP